MSRFGVGGGRGGGGGGEDDVEKSRTYLWKNPGYAPGLRLFI